MLSSKIAVGRLNRRYLDASSESGRHCQSLRQGGEPAQPMLLDEGRLPGPGRAAALTTARRALGPPGRAEALANAQRSLCCRARPPASPVAHAPPPSCLLQWLTGALRRAVAGGNGAALARTRARAGAAGAVADGRTGGLPFLAGDDKRDVLRACTQRRVNGHGLLLHAQRYGTHVDTK